MSVSLASPERIRGGGVPRPTDAGCRLKSDSVMRQFYELRGMSTSQKMLLSALESEPHCVAIYSMFVPDRVWIFVYPPPLYQYTNMIFGHEVLLMGDDIITLSDTISNNKFSVLQERLSYMYSKIFYQSVHLSHEPQSVNLRKVLCFESYDSLLFLNIIISDNISVNICSRRSIPERSRC